MFGIRFLNIMSSIVVIMALVFIIADAGAESPYTVAHKLVKLVICIKLLPRKLIKRLYYV